MSRRKTLAQLAGFTALTVPVVAGSANAHHDELDEEEVLSELVYALEEEGFDVPYWSKSATRHGGTVWVTAVDKAAHNDLHGVSFANGDNDYVRDQEKTYRRIAKVGADVGNRLADSKKLYGDEVIALLGTGGRNESMGPMMRLEFSEGEYEHPDNGFGRVIYETYAAQNDLSDSQRKALQLRGGFGDVYDKRDRLILTETLDGWDNGREDDGEFELSGQGWELQFVEDNRGLDNKPKAVLREVTHGDSDYRAKGEADEFDVGHHRVKITDLDEAGYMELWVKDGHYQDVVDDPDRLPFPQVSDPLGGYRDH